MPHSFPPDFFFGTSTAAAQVETVFDHPWKGLVAHDGYVFDRTTDHEKRRAEDAGYIARLGTVYRCGVDWSRLQRAPYAAFDPAVVAKYRAFFDDLRERGVSLMFVFHHFTNPNWFESAGSWQRETTIPYFIDYARRCIEHFGEYASHFNTFNEPNVYALNAWALGNFPPFKKNILQANRALRYMGKAHDVLYDLLKEAYPVIPVGISFNTAWFKGANWLGKLPAALMDWWFLTKAARPFERVDFWGLSYYAYVLFDPLPVTEVERPGRLAAMGVPHDKMWGYRPDGFGRILRRFHRRYGKPIIVTENGICTDDQDRRIAAIDAYLHEIKQCMDEGVDVRGYVHWSTWDNFEWHLGPTFRFGLVRVDFDTMERSMTAAGAYYGQLVAAHREEV